MLILCYREIHDRRIGIARDDAGQLELERQELLEDAGLATEPRKGRRQVFAAIDPLLPLAVVAQPAALEDSGQQVRNALAQVFDAADGLVRPDLEPGRSKELLFGDTVLGDRDAVGGRAHHAVPRQVAQAFGRHVLELGGDGGTARRQ